MSPRHAILLGEALAAPESENLVSRGLSQWAQRDPRSTLLWIEQNMERDRAITLVQEIGSWLDEFPAALEYANWLANIDADEAETLLASNIHYRAYVDGSNALAVLADLPDGFTKERILGIILERATIERQPVGEEFLRETARQWCTLAPDQAAPWLKAHWPEELQRLSPFHE